MSKWIALFLIAANVHANDEVRNAVSTLTSPGAELSRRLDAVDKLAALKATRELITAWSQGGAAVRLAVPVGFHAVGVRGLGHGLTALGSVEEGDRAAGAVLLGSIGRDARLGVNKLVISLNDESGLVRRCAAEALGNIGAAAEDSISGLIALAMEHKELAPIAVRSITQITLDVQLHEQRKKLPDPVNLTIGPAENWLLRQQKEDGSWGNLNTTALVVLALAEGGLREEFRRPVRRAMRHFVLKLARRPKPLPLVLLATHATMRQTRDPLLRILADRVGEKVKTMSTDQPADQAWRLLALRDAQFTGDMLDRNLLVSTQQPQPDLIGIVIAPVYDAKAASAAAERMVTDKLVWRPREMRWSPGQIVRGSWAIHLAGGDSAERYRKMVYSAAIPKRLQVDAQTARWEPPQGVQATSVEMTAAVVAALKIVSGRYPPRVLPRPKAAKQRIAVQALRGCLKHPNAELRAYAESMLSLWG